MLKSKDYWWADDEILTDLINSVEHKILVHSFNTYNAYTGYFWFYDVDFYKAA